jgi:hypothetical protein
LQKQKHQLGESVHEDFDFIFSQNGLEAYKGKDLIAKAVKTNLNNFLRVSKII